MLRFSVAVVAFLGYLLSLAVRDQLCCDWFWQYVFFFFFSKDIERSFLTDFVVMAYWHLRRRALQFQEFESSNSRVNRFRYQRLLGMTAVVLTFAIIINVAVLRINAEIPLQPQVSWDFIHANYYAVNTVPRVLMTESAVMALESQRWASIISAFVFFAFFGFADEARSHYRKTYATLTKVVGLGSDSLVTGTRRGPIGMRSFSASPSFVRRSQSFTRTLSVVYSPTVPSICTFTPLHSPNLDRQKRDTVDSFIDTLSIVESGKSLFGPPVTRHYPPGLNPVDLTAASSPRTSYSSFDPAQRVTLPQRHEPDAPRSARPYSTWSDTV
jgi:hypothetical protein